jgi:signal transduction histidine kinase
MPSEFSTVHGDRSVKDLERELTEAREQQFATHELLRVIGRAHADPQQVFEAIAYNAVQLCAAKHASIWLFDGRMLRAVATHNVSPERKRLIEGNPIVPGSDSAVGRAALGRRTVHIADVLADSELTYSTYRIPSDPTRTVLVTPMLNGSALLGAIFIHRNEVQPFSASQVALLEAFANQAVIAIENTRLFEGEQASKRELHAALEYQTAISEVLGVISRSPNDLQPVLDTIVKTAARLCNADTAAILRLQDGQYRFAANDRTEPAYVKYLTDNPILPGRQSVAGRVALDGRTVHIHDALADPEYTYAAYEKNRTKLGVPLLRDGSPIGVIVLNRRVVQPFTRKQISLVETFADQAVIAIENAHLFEEVQARTRELTQAPEQQTATSEVLGVISGSPGDLEPVFQAMLANAMRICEAKFGHLLLYDGECFRAAYLRGVPQSYRAIWERGPICPGPSTGLGRMVHSKQAFHIPDISADAVYSEGDPLRVATVELAGARTILGVPMLKHRRLIGAIVIYRQDVRPFSDKQIELVTNFASQAVIAIENTRLLNELRQSLQQQTATADVLKVISRSAFDLKAVLNTLVESAAHLCKADMAEILRPNGDAFDYLAEFGFAPEHRACLETQRIPTGLGSLAGRTLLHAKPVQIADVQCDPEYTLTEIAKIGGQRTLLGVPLLREGTPIGVITLQRKTVQPFEDKQIELLTTFADQAVIAIENTRLFEEVQARTRELAKTVDDLEIASQHKSQFVANMSHELRTPLAAILGYAELMQEGFYEAQGPKSLDALTRIRSNGKHLLGLINTVLDIAKIESGQFTLNMAEYAIESVVETVRSATESLAHNKKLSLKTEVAKSMPAGLGDEQRLTQVLLNLVGNAIKFTDAGEVRVSATAANSHFAISVADTGPGIAEAHQARIFEQFHQVDSSNTKAKGGTGLGLAIAREIVEMHGGRIWVKSTLGEGSTFQMELPIRAEFRKRVP